MKNKLIYIFIVVALSVGFFSLGWQMHPKVQPPTSETIQAIDTGTNLDEYEEYTSSLDTVCPFVSTAFTGKCLDDQISKQKQLYDSLLKELLDIAKAKTDLSGILGYSETRDANIAKLCSFRNVLITGSGIVIESRKCTMYYNAVDIQTLKQMISDFKSYVFPD